MDAKTYREIEAELGRHTAFDAVEAAVRARYDEAWERRLQTNRFWAGVFGVWSLAGVHFVHQHFWPDAPPPARAAPCAAPAAAREGERNGHADGQK